MDAIEIVGWILCSVGIFIGSFVLGYLIAKGQR